MKKTRRTRRTLNQMMWGDDYEDLSESEKTSRVIREMVLGAVLGYGGLGLLLFLVCLIGTIFS